VKWQYSLHRVNKPFVEVGGERRFKKSAQEFRPKVYPLAAIKELLTVKQRLDEREADKLRPHGPEDHEIRLPEGTIAPFARNYKPMN
jgi:hypothetical protein